MILILIFLEFPRNGSQLYERHQTESPPIGILLDQLALSLREFHKFQHFYIFIHSVVFLFKIPTAERSGRKLGVRIHQNTMVQGIIPIHHLTDLTLHHTKKKKKRPLAFNNPFFLFTGVPCKARHFQKPWRASNNLHQFHRPSFLQSKRTPHNSWPN